MDKLSFPRLHQLFCVCHLGLKWNFINKNHPNFTGSFSPPVNFITSVSCTLFPKCFQKPLRDVTYQVAPSEYCLAPGTLRLCIVPYCAPGRQSCFRLHGAPQQHCDPTWVSKSPMLTLSATTPPLVLEAAAAAPPGAIPDNCAWGLKAVWWPVAKYSLRQYSLFRVPPNVVFFCARDTAFFLSFFLLFPPFFFQFTDPLLSVRLSLQQRLC